MTLQITIIIPIYNVAQYLPQCLASIISELRGQEEIVEVLAIDDGSHDESGKIADNYAEKNPFFTVIHQSNKGVAAARNTGMELARGEWIYIMDSDDWLARGCISSMCKAIQKSPDAEIIMFDAFKNTGSREMDWSHFDNSTVWEDKESIRRLQRGMLYFPAVDRKTKVPMAAPWDKLYNREFLQRHHLRFHEELKVLDDMVFNMEAFGAASKVAYCKEQIYHYRYVQDSITNCFRPDRVRQDIMVWNRIKEYMRSSFSDKSWDSQDKEEFRQAYYCRVAKSFSICCRLCFFNTQNKKSLKDKIRYVKQVLKLEPYEEAFNKVKIRKAEWRLKAVILLGRIGAGGGIYLLHVADRWANKAVRLLAEAIYPKREGR